MAVILAANPEKGSTSSAWTAGDQRGRGALQAIEAMGSTDENIVTTRIDANSRACDMIARVRKLEASMDRDFKCFGAATAEAMKHQAHERNRCTLNRLSPPSGQLRSGSRVAIVGQRLQGVWVEAGQDTTDRSWPGRS